MRFERHFDTFEFTPINRTYPKKYRLRINCENQSSRGAFHFAEKFNLLDSLSNNKLKPSEW